MRETFKDLQISKEVLFAEVNDKLDSKNMAYASREQVFLNFNIGAMLLGTNRVKYGLSLLAKHIVRLMRDGDTMKLDILLEITSDMIAYLVLIYSMRRADNK